MSDLILHQYATSPFSEKVRLLLGYKSASYSQVEMSVIMPRPDLMPLTGGYRKTPVMQIGADVYCDTAMICRVIDEIFPDNSIYPTESIGVASALAHWTDTFFFKVCVAVAFQPRAMADNPLFQDEEAMAAFMKDRAELSQGSTELGMAFEIAEPHFLAHLDGLDQQLQEGNSFLFGERPCIADFSTYHNVWFIYVREAIRDYLDSFPALMDWYGRMSAFGHGEVTEIEGAAAVQQAADSEPDEITEPVFIENLEAGQTVEVMPIDYGFQPVRGELLSAGLDEIAVARTDERAGRVVVHFPRMGFQIVTTQ